MFRPVQGNAKGYRLCLERYPDCVPVSREAGKMLLGQLQRLAG